MCICECECECVCVCVCAYIRMQYFTHQALYCEIKSVLLIQTIALYVNHGVVFMTGFYNEQATIPKQTRLTLHLLLKQKFFL